MIVTLDFETEAIVGNPSVQAPEPVGLAIKWGNKRSKYLAWGHPTNNNCEWPDAHQELYNIWHSKHQMLFHNGKFDVAVALQHFDFDMPDPLRILDTMFCLFLDNPYSNNLALKPSAEKYLNVPPDEQDKLTDWVMFHVKECRSRNQAGRYIARAPGDLVGEYARGDVDRTKQLHDLLMPRITQQGMLKAYQREQFLMPVTYYSERKGIRVDTEKLEEDLQGFEAALQKVERRLLKPLKVKELDFNKNELVADALENSGIVKPKDWVLTPKGKRSTSKENLILAVKDPKILSLLRYRGAMAGCLQTFARPWLELAQQDGRLHTSWNQVRTHPSGSDSSGSRTGRLSASKPSFMNVPNEYKIDIPRGLPTPPMMRQYLLPEQDHYWLKRDFSSQEVRILAHFEDGVLMEAYVANPDLDPHAMAQELIKGISGVMYARKDVKITGFSIIYGSGVSSLGAQLGRPRNEAQSIKDAYLQALPGVRKLQRATNKRGKAGKSVTTWGGRIYFKEPGIYKNGVLMDFSYKLLNYLIQGSAADQTKQVIVDWWNERDEDEIFLATVHDEINMSAPIETWEESMDFLRTCMEQDLFDVPMRSEGFYGPNWFDLKECA